MFKTNDFLVKNLLHLYSGTVKLRIDSVINNINNQTI